MFSQVSTLILVATLTIPAVSFAKSEFPFQVNRDSKGKLVSIELPKSMKLMSSGEDEDELNELRSAIAAQSAERSLMKSVATEIEEEAPIDKEERETYNQAKEEVGLGVASNAANDKRLDPEFSKAKSEVAKVKAWRLLAAPTQPGAFDTESAVADAVKYALDGAKLIFDTTPVFSVFEFLVDTHIENLKSRREFYQNQLLIAIDQDTTLFTSAEKSAIRSSIFYSRLGFERTNTRESARKNWSAWGNSEYKKAMAVCNGFAPATSIFGACFKMDGQELRNRLVKKNRLSKSPSLAFDYSEPKRMRAKREFLYVTRLGLKLIPVPGLLKKPVSLWLTSQYIEQRRSEGYLMGFAYAKDPKLAPWIIYGSANPLLGK